MPIIKIFLLSLFVILGTLVLSSFSLKQKADLNDRIIIHQENEHDAFWHIALISSIKRTGIPPENPVFSGHLLKNYHYFNDLLLAIVSKLTGISIFWLYLRFAPFLLALLFVLTTFILMKKFFNNTFLSVFATSFSLFGAGFSWVAPLFFPKAGNHQSVFWLDQPIRYGINQQLLLSLVLINVLFILEFSKNKHKWLFSGVILGILSAVKIYGSIVMIAAFVVVSILNFKDRGIFARIKALFVAALIFALVVLNTQNKAGFPFIWAPGWFIRTMFEAEDRLNFSTWEIHRQLFVQKNNILRLIFHFGWGALIFYLGNFGVKIFGVIAFPLFLKSYKSLSAEKRYIFALLFSTIIISLLFPMFFIQKGVVWNSIQFMHYASVPLVILLVWSTNRTIKNNLFKATIFIFMLLLSLPTNFLTIMKDMKNNSYNVYDRAIINRTLKSCQTKRVLILGNKLNTNSFIPAICERSVFFADKVQNDITFVDSSEREKIIQKIENKEINLPKNSTYAN